MAKRAWCSGCNGYVVLAPEEICPEGHPRSSLRAIAEVEGDVRPSMSPESGWRSGATEALPSSSSSANWVIPAAIAGSLCVALLVALASPLAGLAIGTFVLGTLLSAVALWVGMKLTGVSGNYLGPLAISAVCSAVQLVPYLGGLLSVVVMFALISRWLRVPVWPDAVLMVVVARAVASFGALVVLGMLVSV